MNKIMRGLREAVEVARGNYDVIEKITPSCGCVFCDLNDEPLKLRRRWVHHSSKSGRIVVCGVRNLKPES